MEYEGDAWLGYDRRFRQRAASNPQASWAKSDSTLWYMEKQRPTAVTTVLVYLTSHQSVNGSQRFLNQCRNH